jgi:hypothetical protein
VDTSLDYFIDRPPEEAWVIHDGAVDTSGYNASCSFPVRTSAGVNQLYTGDYAGFIWKLEQATRSDDGNGYYGGFTTPHMAFDNPRVRKHYRRGYVVSRTQGNYNLQARVWVDGEAKASKTVDLSGAGGVLDTDVLGSFVLGGSEFLDRRFELGHFGKRLQVELYNTGAGQDFFVSQVLIDNKMMGPLPDRAGGT